MEPLQRRLEDALRASGRRVTAQRRLILGVLAEEGGHVDAGALYDRVRARDPSIGLATVYRTLAILKEVGLVGEHRLSGDRMYYELLQGQPQHHFTCLRCGRVIEFDTPLVDRIERELAEREGLDVARIQVHVSGYCARCRGAGDRPAAPAT